MEVKFAGGEAKTKVIKSCKDPKINQELWLPVMLPTMTKTITVEIWDWDAASFNDLIGTVYLRFIVLACSVLHLSMCAFSLSTHTTPLSSNPRR